MCKILENVLKNFIWGKLARLLFFRGGGGEGHTLDILTEHFGVFIQ
jgi:hypothetical protein